MTDATFERDLIAYLTERGYRVTRPRQRLPRQLTGKRLLSEHKAHRATHTLELDTCRLCRFAGTVREHATHTGDVDGCFLCLDRRTAYLYPSRMLAGDMPELGEVIRRYHAA